jgi:hypothetical protein
MDGGFCFYAYSLGFNGMNGSLIVLLVPFRPAVKLSTCDSILLSIQHASTTPPARRIYFFAAREDAIYIFSPLTSSLNSDMHVRVSTFPRVPRFNPARVASVRLLPLLHCIHMLNARNCKRLDSETSQAWRQELSLVQGLKGDAEMASPHLWSLPASNRLI